MTLRSWLRSGLVVGGLLLAAGESFAQRGGGGGPGGGGFPGGGRGMGGSPEERWAQFAGNSDSYDLKDPKNAMVAGMISKRYQIPPDGILRRSSYLEQATAMSGGGGRGPGGPPGMGGPGGYPTAPGAAPGAAPGDAPGAAPGGTFVIVGQGSDPAIAPPGSGGFPGGPGGGKSGRGGPGGPGGDRGPGGDPQQQGGGYPQPGGQPQGDRQQQGDPIEDPRPFVVRYGNMPKDAAPFFNELDKDRDGQISLYEWRTGGKAVEEFVALDLNNDGFLTVEEHNRAMQLAAEEKNGGKKLTDSRFGSRGPGAGGFGPGAGGSNPWARNPTGGGEERKGGEDRKGGEQPSKGEERGGKGGKGGKGQKGG